MIPALSSRLYLDRTKPGVLNAPDFATTSWRCLGKADSQEAARHDNPKRDPTRPFGDHPCGEYRLIAIHEFPVPSYTYGPGWLSLEPVSGDALQAHLNGRFGILIHGGELRGGALRPTHGCLRVDNETMVTLLNMWAAGELAHGDVYACTEGGP